MRIISKPFEVSARKVTLSCRNAAHLFLLVFIYLFSYFAAVLKSIYYQFTVARNFLGLIILTQKIKDYNN